MPSPILELKSVSKKFGSITAVRQLSLHIHPGEIYGLIGPNGSGKSTTLKMVAGIYGTSKGLIKIAGEDISEKPTKTKKLIAYVPDEPVGYGRLTGREFLQFVGELYRMDRTERDRNIAVLLAEYKLDDLADGPFESMSRGTRQKLSFVAALIHKPSLLLIDEPMVGLDPESARTTKRLLEDFTDRGGAILLVTHTLSVAQEICHRIGIIRDGELLEEGRIAQLKDKAGLSRGTLEDFYLRIIHRS